MRDRPASLSITRETLQTIWDIYLETDDLVGAASSTRKAVMEVRWLLDIAEPSADVIPIRPGVRGKKEPYRR